MTESAFEARLARGLRDMADDGLRPFDPRAVAEAVVATQRASFGTRRWMATREGRRVIWLAAAALLLLAALMGLALLGSQAPTSERLAFIRNGDIWVSYADGRDARLVVVHDVKAVETGGCTGVQWSTDGSRLAALDINSGGPGKRRIVVMTSDGTSRGSFDVEHGPIAMAWSPDGDHLAVLAPQASVGGLWLLDREGKLERELALPPQYRAAKALAFISVSWSPDGRSLAITGCPCSSENSGSWILSVDGSGAREIQFPGEGSAMSLAWSPDGKRLAIGSGKWTEPSRALEGPGELWVMNVDRASAERISDQGRATHRHRMVSRRHVDRLLRAQLARRGPRGRLRGAPSLGPGVGCNAVVRGSTPLLSGGPQRAPRFAFRLAWHRLDHGGRSGRRQSGGRHPRGGCTCGVRSPLDLASAARPVRVKGTSAGNR